MYIKRHVENVVERQSKNFPVVVVTGARQVGKSTMLQHKCSNANQITLNTHSLRQAATKSPTLFFDTNPPPIIVDEIQRAPILLEHIKEIVDINKVKGQFYLSGSQSFHLMQNVSESLAGRAGIINLMGLSYREISSVNYFDPFKPTKEHILWMKDNGASFNYSDIIKTIWQGSFPALYTKELSFNEWTDFYNSYLQTYIERDVKQITQVQDEDAFLRFIKGIAALTGQQLNYSTLAQICGKDLTTIKRWLSILQTSGLVHLLYPYFNNPNKRLSKTPKLYFVDTGLACFLLGWNSPTQLANGALWGHIFETYAICEVLKSYYNNGSSPLNLYYYRDKNGIEIDLIIEEGNSIYPVEIKTTSDPTTSMTTSFKTLNSIPNKTINNGAIICMCKTPLPISNTLWSIPINHI